MSTKTTNFSFIKPENGNTEWGDAIRGDFVEIDNQLIVAKQGSNTAASTLAFHRTSGNHNDRYYTKDQLDTGVLDTLYYTKSELDAGSLDSRYYTKTEIYSRSEVYSKTEALALFETIEQALAFLSNRYYRKSVIADPLNNRYYSKAAVADNNITSYKNAIDTVKKAGDTIMQTFSALNIKPFLPRSVPYEIISSSTFTGTPTTFERLGSLSLIFGQRISNVTEGVDAQTLNVNLKTWYSELIKNGNTGTNAPANIMYIILPASLNKYGLKAESDTDFRKVYKSA